MTASTGAKTNAVNAKLAHLVFAICSMKFPYRLDSARLPSGSLARHPPLWSSARSASRIPAHSPGIHLSLRRLTGAEARRPPRSKHHYFTVKVTADEELAVKFCDPAKLAVME